MGHSIVRMQQLSGVVMTIVGGQKQEPNELRLVVHGLG